MTDYLNNISAKLEIIKASDITPKEVRWLWYPYIPFGKVTLLQGDPGDGKSKLMFIRWSLRPYCMIWGCSLHATPVFSSASLFPEALTPCWLFSLIMASHLMGWPRRGFRVVHRAEKRTAENTAKPRRNCSGEALLLTT